MKKAILILIPATVSWLVIQNQKRSIAMKFIKAEKIKTINTKTLIVALDIGKNIHYAYFRAPNGKDIRPFPFYNTSHSFDNFWEKLSRFKESHMLDEVVIGFESTGPYAEPICHYLRKKSVKLVQINPMHTKRVKELTGNSPGKTDKKDPRVSTLIFRTRNRPNIPAAQSSRWQQTPTSCIKRAATCGYVIWRRCTDSPT